MTNEKDINNPMDDYLKRFGWSLGELPQPERDEIIKEIRSHLEDRLQASETDEEFQRVLDDFGPPEIYARSFLDGYEVATALASGSPGRMLKQNFRMMSHNRFKVAFTFFGIAIVYGTSIAFLIGSFMRFFFPQDFGFWLSLDPISFYYGLNLSPDKVDALGILTIPVSLLISFILMKLGLSLSRRSLVSFAEKRAQKKAQKKK